MLGVSWKPSVLKAVQVFWEISLALEGGTAGGGHSYEQEAFNMKPGSYSTVKAQSFVLHSL